MLLQLTFKNKEFSISGFIRFAIKDAFKSSFGIENNFMRAILALRNTSELRFLVGTERAGKNKTAQKTYSELSPSIRSSMLSTGNSRLAPAKKTDIQKPLITIFIIYFVIVLI